MTTTRTWTRDREQETPDWTGEPSWWSRYYVSSDGWIAVRIYSPGDRYLNHPGIAWYVSRTDWPDGTDSWRTQECRTLAEAKVWVDSEQAISRRLEAL